MKVAVLIDTWFPFIGGGQINALEISKRLAAKNTFIDIVTRDNGIEGLKLPKNLKIIKLGPRADSDDMFSKILFIIRSFLFVSKRDYDLIHAHAFLPGITAKLLMMTKKIPAVFTVHGTSIGTNLNNFFMSWVEKFILTQIRYSAQITVSQDFLKISNVNKHITYIPNGVDVGSFDKIQIQKAKDPTLIYVGRLHPQKNLPTLLQCINKLKQEFPRVQLLIVGSGQEKHKLLGIVKNLHLSKHIKLLGEIKDAQLIELYKFSHLFILPSVYEGQPLSLLEAWAAKLPVVVTKTGDCQFLVKNGINGYLISNPYDVKEIANVIKKALSKTDLDRIGQNGYNLVKNNFSWEKSSELSLKLYKQIINGKYQRIFDKI